MLMPNLIAKRISIPALAGLLLVLAVGRANDQCASAAEKASEKSSAKLAKALQVLQSVEPKGVDNRAASKAWREIAAADAEQLPIVLAAIDEAGPLGANWISAAVQAIADGQLKQGAKLPAADLEAFVLDVKHAPRGRRLAFEWLVRADGTAADRLTPGFLYDPSPELRRDAVARLIEAGDQLVKEESPEEAQKIYDKALSGACDLDQVQKLKEALEKLGEKVDLPKHFGFITHWKLIGPFDNTDEKAFDTAYLPENSLAKQSLDLAAEYEAKPKDGKPRKVKWIDHETKDDYGVVDLNEVISKENGVVAYAWAEFDSPRAQPAELRLGRDNAAKVWLNGELVHEHRVYHSGSNMDQFVGRGQLRKGRNVIVVKVLQNEQKEEWAQTWGFQLRVCDATGAAVRSGGGGSEGVESRK